MIVLSGPFPFQGGERVPCAPPLVTALNHVVNYRKKTCLEGFSLIISIFCAHISHNLLLAVSYLLVAI